MSAIISIDLRRFKGDVDRFRRESKQTFRTVMISQMGLWCKDLQRQFPPSKKLGGGKGSPRSQGQRAVGIGLSETVVPIIMGSARQTRTFDDYVMYQNPETQAVWLIPQGKFRPGASESEVAQAHNAARDKRTGRPPNRHSNKYKSFTVVDQLHVKRATYRKYLSKLKKDVGTLKGGWVAGMLRFGQRAPAGWIANHKATGSAWGPEGRGMNIMMGAENDNKWASRYPSIVASTLATRGKDLKKQAIKRLNADVRKENARSKRTGAA